MALIAFPDIRMPSEYFLDVKNYAYGGPSGESLQGQIIQVLGSPWICRMSWQQLNPTHTDLLRAFLDQMQGIANMTQLWCLTRPAPLGTVTGAPLVNGAGQTGKTLNVDGMGVGTTLLAGDYIGRANRLYRLTANATANGSGQATLSITPSILTATADNEVVTIVKPKAYFRLSQNFNPLGTEAPLRKGWSKGITLEFVETLP